MTSNDPKFLNPLVEIEKHTSVLPHWQQEKATFFVTFRTADSIPQAKLVPLAAAREAWMRLHSKPWSPEKELEYHKLFTRQIETWLDHGEGECLLRDPKLAAVVGGRLEHFKDERYVLYAWVVMPNHVHVLFSLTGENRLEDVVQGWKSVSSHEINRLLGRTGSLWQRDYFDRLIRSRKHFDYCVNYIRENPEKAHLRAGSFLLWSEGAPPS
jgi:REP element-mobilizing transposase RayT